MVRRNACYLFIHRFWFRPSSFVPFWNIKEQIIADLTSGGNRGGLSRSKRYTLAPGNPRHALRKTSRIVSVCRALILRPCLPFLKSSSRWIYKWRKTFIEAAEAADGKNNFRLEGKSPYVCRQKIENSFFLFWKNSFFFNSFYFWK